MPHGQRDSPCAPRPDRLTDTPLGQASALWIKLWTSCTLLGPVTVQLLVASPQPDPATARNFGPLRVVALARRGQPGHGGQNEARSALWTKQNMCPAKPICWRVLGSQGPLGQNCGGCSSLNLGRRETT